jgi:hypothetical protein
MTVRAGRLLLCIGLLGGVAAIATLISARSRYVRETTRLRAGMSAVERGRADALLQAASERDALLLQFVQRQAAGDDAVHLALDATAGTLALDRGAVRLRTMPVRIGAERRVGSPPDTLRIPVPRGLRRIERLLGPSDTLELPAWLWIDRGLPVPTVRHGAGWTGTGAILTSGGTLLYTLPTAGPLADSRYVMPGAVRLAPADFAAVRESLRAGLRVWFF